MLATLVRSAAALAAAGAILAAVPDVFAQGKPKGGGGKGAMSRNPGPKVGDPAPDFAIKTLDGKATVKLSEILKAKKPVALVFGSYT
ncbi:MAG: hypothetical protein L0216_01785 [Planctomycetales bacterium]|nr:hypothetical protein [Planctomycetales bacterium]